MKRVMDNFKRKHNKLLKSRPNNKPLRLLCDNDRVYSGKRIGKWFKDHCKGLKLEFLPTRSPDLQICDYWHHPWIKKTIHDENKIFELTKQKKGRAAAEKEISSVYKDGDGTSRRAAEGMHKRIRDVVAHPSVSAEDSRIFRK